MKKSGSLLAARLLVAGTFSPSRAAYATRLERAVSTVPSAWQKSASIVPNSASQFGSAAMRASLRELRATGANFVMLVIPIFQNSLTGSVISAGTNTPTDASLLSAAKYARGLGLAVSFKIHIDVRDRPDQWCGRIDPSNRALWFARYGARLVHYGRIGAKAGVRLYILGTELNRVTENSVHP